MFATSSATSSRDAEVFAHGAAKEKLYREMMQPHVEEALVPGVREFLTRHRDLKLGVATNAEKANVDFVLDSAGLRDFSSRSSTAIR